MKKKIVIVVTFFLLCVLLTNCSKDELIKINEETLMGVWYEEFSIEEENQISRLEYFFNDANKYEVLRKRIDITTGVVLGYRHRQLGDYKIENDQLTFYNLETYSNDDIQGSYADINSLKLISQSENSYSVTIEFRDSEKTLIFIYPPCPPNANCIGQKTLKRGE